MFARLKQLWAGKTSGLTRQQKSGNDGERLAAEMLEKTKGMKILARNWRSPRDHRDEIDLVALDSEILVFIEVKTRSENALVAGFYAVDKRKKKALLRACRAYINSLAPQDRPHTMRFDVIEVSTSASNESEVRHFENIPLFLKCE